MGSCCSKCTGPEGPHEKDCLRNSMQAQNRRTNVPTMDWLEKRRQEIDQRLAKERRDKQDKKINVTERPRSSSIVVSAADSPRESLVLSDAVSLADKVQKQYQAARLAKQERLEDIRK